MKTKIRIKRKLLKALGANVRTFRLEKKISQEALAFKIGVDRTYIGAIEQGLRSPSIYCLFMLANALGKQLKDLAEFSIEQ